MPAQPQNRWRRRFRRFLRGLAITLLLLVFFLVAAVTYLNEVGLPDFAKNPLLRELHSRGLDLQFTRVRFRFRRGIVAENVRFGRANGAPDSPKLSAREVELQLNHAALRRFTLDLDAITLRGGQVVWPLATTNTPARRLSLDAIQTQLRFLPDDHWQLDNFIASFAGANLQISGAITNASAISGWEIFHAQAGAQPRNLQSSLGRLESVLGRLKFSRPPEIKLDLHGDGRDLQSFHGLLTVQAQDAQTPWGALTNGLLVVRLIPRTETNARPHGEFTLRAGSAKTPWASARNLQLDVRGVSDQADTNLVHARLTLLAEACHTEWAQAPQLHFTAAWSHSFTNAIPLAGEGELLLAKPHTRWGDASELAFNGRLITDANAGPARADPGWAWWANLEPFVLSWQGRLKEFHNQDFQVHELACGGLWHAPDLTITNLHSELYGGELSVDAGLNVATRRVAFKGSTDFDAKRISPLLSESARDWLQLISWERPPLLVGGGEMILPAWTNRQPDWGGQVLPTLNFQAELEIGPVAYKTISILSAHTHVGHSNLTWNLPDLVVNRPEGQLKVALVAEERTQRFYSHVHNQTDIKILRPLFEPDGQAVLDSVTLTEPPLLDAEIWGQGNQLDRIGIKATVSVTNFTVRGESASHLQAALQYTNRFLLVTEPRAERGTQHLAASSLGVDFAAQTIHVTNGFSTFEPLVMLHIIGPKVTAEMEPYQFRAPPTVWANGDIPLADNVPPNLHFQVEGGPFHWLRFNATHVSSGVHWVGDNLNLTDLKADYYQGALTGSAAFDFSPRVGTLFAYELNLTNVDFHSLIADAFENPTNQLEGRLSGHLAITRADSADWQSWFGRGEAQLHHGFIWEIPIFGIFSKFLDGVAPDLKLGESRANEGSATFIITNSIIYSDDLLIRAPGLTMRYRGTVDFDGKTIATVEAKPLKDIPLIGPVATLVLSPLTKFLEYKVTGTLTQPQAEPQNVPKLFMDILHPIGTLKKLLPGGSRSTNSPPTGATGGGK